MSWGIRVNENNVDLNRNWVDFDAPLPQQLLFQELARTMPAGLAPDHDGLDQWADWVETQVTRHGKWAVDDALSCGQYQMPTGPGFGGFEPQWSRRVLEQMIPALAGRARHIVYIDWHSLLRTGNGTLIFLCFNQTDGALFRRAGSWWGEDRIRRSTVNAQWTSGSSAAGKRPSRNGLLMWGVQRLLAPKADVAGAVIEFCTDRPLTDSLERMELEEDLCDQYLSLTRDRTSLTGQRARRLHMEACCPSDPVFRSTMISAGEAAFANALAGAAQWAREDVAPAPELICLSSSFD
jgi:hypothetical protein